MAGITGQGTTFNLPNYAGELFSVSPEDTPFLSAIGGLTGGEAVHSTQFSWSSYDLRDASATAQKVEGAAAPAGDERVRVNGFNVLEIHQEAVEVSYTKQAATGLGVGGTALSGVNSNVTDELGWQLTQALKAKARDIESTFINGTFANPATNATPRRTRGLLQAITTNVGAPTAGPLVEADVLDLMQAVWTAGGIQEGETRTLLCNAAVRRALTKIFITDKGYQESTRNVGGVSVKVIDTDFGAVSVMLDRYMPADVLAVVSLEECAPVFLEIPGKGHFFAEPLAKTGASEKVQIYGEIGLKYGNERKHGKLSITA